MRQKVFLRGLWISAFVLLILAFLQGITGHWIAFFLIWPGGPAFGQALTALMVKFPSYHIGAGFTIGFVSLLIPFFAFLSKTHIIVRIFSILGLALIILTVMGGYLFVTSGFQDRVSLGQMADAFVGVFADYFLLLIFLVATSKFPWGRSSP